MIDMKLHWRKHPVEWKQRQGAASRLSWGMPASISEIFNAINEGSAGDLRALLNRKGVKWPKDPAMHPVLDLLALAARKDPPAELAEKLAVLLDFGTDVEFKLPHRHKVQRARQRTAYLGIPGRYGRNEDNLLAGQATLLARAAGIGRPDLVDVLMDRGAQARYTGVGNKDNFYPLMFAGEQGQMDTLIHLVEKLGMRPFKEPGEWSIWAKPAIKNMPKDREDVLDLVVNTCPDPNGPKAARAIMAVLSNTGQSRANIKWLERDPGLWAKLHDDPQPDDKQKGYLPTLWKVVLEDALVRGTQTALFRTALAHGSRTGLINQPIMEDFLMMWGSTQDDPDKELRLGWSARKVFLPPMQALLHDIAKVKDKSQYRRTMRVARGLMRGGAKLWVGEDGRGAPVTEAMLWEDARRRPNQKWLAKHPEFLLPHVLTGQTPIDAAMTVKGVQHWVDCGISLTHRDCRGNQAMASLLMRAGGGWADPTRSYASNAPDWAKWIEAGWVSGTLPMEGDCYGKSMGAWACARNDLATTWSRKTKRSIAKEPGALHVAAQHLNATTMVRLLEDGADPAALDERQWTPLAYLAAATQRVWNGNEDASAKRIQAILSKNPWPDNIPGQRVDPWQIALSTNSAYKFFLRDYDHAFRELFWDLHARRLNDENRWASQDSPLMLRHFSDHNQKSSFRFLVDTLPQVMLDDMALTLFDPDRWPEGQEDGVILGSEHLKYLLSRGANLSGWTIEGKRLTDTWKTLQDHEDHLRQRGDEDLRAALSLMNIPETQVALSALQAQRLDTNTPSSGRPSGLRRRL